MPVALASTSHDSTLDLMKVGVHFFNQTLSGGPGALRTHLRDTTEAAEVAKYADANNLFPTSPEQVQHKLDVLARHCEDVGRDRSEIRNTTISRIGPDTDVEAFVDQIASYAALGFEDVQLGLLTTEPAQLVKETVSKIVPRLADL